MLNNEGRIALASSFPNIHTAFNPVKSEQRSNNISYSPAPSIIGMVPASIATESSNWVILQIPFMDVVFLIKVYQCCLPAGRRNSSHFKVSNNSSSNKNREQNLIIKALKQHLAHSKMLFSNKYLFCQSPEEH